MKNWSIQENKWNVKIKGAGMADTKVHYANNEVFNPHPLTVKNQMKWPGNISFPSGGFHA